MVAERLPKSAAADADEQLVASQREVGDLALDDPFRFPVSVLAETAFSELPFQLPLQFLVDLLEALVSFLCCSFFLFLCAEASPS